MHRRLSSALLLALAFAAATPMLSQPAHAQASERAYAPENLWTLSTADQTRVISMEYREQSKGRQIPDDQLRFYLDQVRLSRWTFSKVKQDIATSLGNTGGGWRPPGPGPVNTIRCESNDGRPRTCNTPWQANSRLVRQLSNARCTLGTSWFTSPGRVTVSNGCRAEFGPGQGAGQTTTVQCESNDGRYRTCGTGLAGRIELQRQLSSTRCVAGSNYGLRGGSVWVDRGCRGVFLVHRGITPPVNDYSVTCSSNQGRYTTCAWDARRGTPRLLQQLSNDACRAGYSWGYSARTGLWVNHGCRARFGTR